MEIKKTKITKWFSPHFLVWLRSFLLFFSVYTLTAVILRYTLIYTIPFIIGFCIAIISQPLIHFLQRKLKFKSSVSAWISPLITILSLLAIIGSIGYLVVHELVGLIGKIPSIDPQTILNEVENWLSNNSLPIAIPAFDFNFLNDNRDTILKVLSQALSYAGTAAKWSVNIITSLPTWIMLIVVVIFSSFTFSKDYEKLKGYVRSLFSDQLMTSLRKTWADGLVMLGKYIRSYLLIYFLTFLQSFILFIVLDIEYPLVWSLLLGVSDIIPILGPGTIYVPMAIVKIVSGDWITGVLLLGGWIFITIIRQFVESKVVADSINIHPLFMLAALFIAFQAGSIGILIYLTFLIVFYNLLKQSGMVHKLFDGPEPTVKKNKLQMLFQKLSRKKKIDEPIETETTPEMDESIETETTPVMDESIETEITPIIGKEQNEHSTVI